MPITYKKKETGLPRTPLLKTNKKVYKIILLTIEDVEAGSTSINHALGFLNGFSKFDKGNIRLSMEWKKITNYIKAMK